MANAAYLVSLVGADAATKKLGANTQLVWAASTAQAKEIAGAKFDGDASIWSGASATLLADAGDLEGWAFTITVFTTVPKVFTYVGTAANNTIDEIGAALVTLINADADIAGAAYASHVLKVAETTDALGDKAVTVDITPPGGFSPLPSFHGTITCSGSSSAALTVGLPATMDTPPFVVAPFKSC